MLINYIGYHWLPLSEQWTQNHWDISRNIFFCVTDLNWHENKLLQNFLFLGYLLMAAYTLNWNIFGIHKLHLSSAECFMAWRKQNHQLLTVFASEVFAMQLIIKPDRSTLSWVQLTQKALHGERMETGSWNESKRMSVVNSFPKWRKGKRYISPC